MPVYDFDRYLDLEFNHRFIDEGENGFRGGDGEGAHTGAVAADEDDCFHWG